MNEKLQNTGGQALQWVVAALICLAVFPLFYINNEFLLGLHLNEKGKVGEVLSGHYYYLHPLFLPLATKFLVWLVQTERPLYIAEIGRTFSAVMATIGVCCTYILVQRRVGMWIAALLALAIAATPLLAVHAHYMKEDACLIGFCGLATLCVDSFFNKITRRNIWLTGLCFGLTAATKFVGLFLIPTLLIAIAFSEKDKRKQRFLATLKIVLIALVVLAAVNYPMIMDFEHARNDLRFSVHIGLAGKDLCCVYHPGALYLTEVLLPELGLPFFLLIIASLVHAILRFRRAESLDRFLLVYAIFYYAMVEISPYRDWPDLSRVPVPLLLPFATFTALFLKDIIAWLEARFPQQRKLATAAVLGVFLLSIVPPVTDAIRLVNGLGHDTREDLARMAGDKVLIAFFEDQTLWFHQEHDFDVPENNDFHQFRNGGYDYLVVSSFIYDKFAFAAQHGGRDNPLVQATEASLNELFQYPYCEIRPHYRTYAYSNPTLRVFAMSDIEQDHKADPAHNGQPCTSASF